MLIGSWSLKLHDHCPGADVRLTCRNLKHARDVHANSLVSQACLIDKEIPQLGMATQEAVLPVTSLPSGTQAADQERHETKRRRIEYKQVS